MPRVSTTDTSDTKKPAARKRVARPRATPVRTTLTSSTRTRRSTPISNTSSSSTTIRRAPTTVGTTQTTRQKNKPSLAFFVVIIFCLIMVGTGAVIGTSDKGQIDIVAVVNDRNERINRGEVREGENITIPVASTQTQNRGRLRAATVDNKETIPTTETMPVSDNTADEVDVITSETTNNEQIREGDGV